MIPSPSDFKKAVSKRTETDEVAQLLSIIGRSMSAGRDKTTFKKPASHVLESVQRELSEKGFLCEVEDL